MVQPAHILPDDQYNRALIAQVHPTDWTNPTPAGRYNLVVIGAGTAGLVTAAGAAGLGAKVALIEKSWLGGDCLNVGCVPSKALVRAARAAADVHDATQFGVRVPDGARVDFPAVMERMRRLRATLAPHDSVERFSKLGVDVFLGEGRFMSQDRIAVGDIVLRFAKAVITTGARPAIPSIPGLKEAGYDTNETIFSLTELPSRLAIIGAGPIGCEMAQVFRRLGSNVSLIEASDRVLIREDRAAAEIVHQTFLSEGIALFLGATIRAVTGRNAAKLLALTRRDGRSETIEADAILVGVGRVPNVEGLGLETVGVEWDLPEGVKVNERLQTTNPRIYAAGDVCSRYRFTHAADALARVVIQNALFMGRAKATALTIPWCTYTDPEVAHVGLYEHEARERGLSVQTFTQPLADVDRAVLDGEEDGFVKVHIQAGTDRILGATIVARHAGDMISELTLAMVAGVGLKTLAKTIHPYPTQAEAIKRVGDAYQRSRLTPAIKALFTRWLSWMR